MSSSWKCTADLLDADPAHLIVKPKDRPNDSSIGTTLPRVAKNLGYVTSIRDIWAVGYEKNNDSDDQKASRLASSSLYRPLPYKGGISGPGGSKEDAGSGKELTFYGTLFKPPSSSSSAEPTTALLPGVVFFQTGAGPHDYYFYWKADELARATAHPALSQPCIVLVSDFTSDSNGWGWDDDKSHYNETKRQILKPDSDSGIRQCLRERIMLAVDTLKKVDGVDPNRIAALGWCVGGQLVMETIRMRIPGIRCVAAFHGVYGGIKDSKGDYIPTLTGDHDDDDDKTKKVDNPPLVTTPLKATICHGVDDPLVDKEEIEHIKQLMTAQTPAALEWTLLEFGGARHAFTNPAMDFNPKPSMEYHPHAAKLSWDTAMTMLAESLV